MSFLGIYILVVIILFFFGEEKLVVDQINGFFNTDFSGVALLCIGLLIAVIMDMIFNK